MLAGAGGADLRQPSRSRVIFWDGCFQERRRGEGAAARCLLREFWQDAAAGAAAYKFQQQNAGSMGDVRRSAGTGERRNALNVCIYD